MADYATIADVNDLVPQSPFTASTNPSQSQVQTFLHDISVMIDATIKNMGYAVPVDVVASPLSGTILRRMCSSGALGLALQVRLTAVSPDQALTNNVWTLRFDKWLTALKDPKDPFELPDASRSGNAIVKPLGAVMIDPTQSSVDAGTSYDPSAYLSDPPFKIGQLF